MVVGTETPPRLRFPAGSLVAPAPPLGALAREEHEKALRQPANEGRLPGAIERARSTYISQPPSGDRPTASFSPRQFPLQTTKTASSSYINKINALGSLPLFPESIVNLLTATPLAKSDQQPWPLQTSSRPRAMLPSPPRTLTMPCESDTC